MAVNLRPAVFIDKDGTLIEDVPYNVDPERIRLVEGAGRALFRLAVADFALVVVSNQSGVARGYFPDTALAGVEERIRDLLACWGVGVTAFCWCPHHPEGNVEPYARECDCRKPEPGLLQRAALLHGFDLARSWMVGDILDDVEAGRRAGCRTILVGSNETEWRPGPFRTPDEVAARFDEVPDIIAGASRRRAMPELQGGHAW